MNSSLVNLAFELCRIPSITYQEQNVVQYLCSWLKDQGFTVELIPVGQDRANIFAYFSNLPKFSAIFCSHLDTVAPFIEPRLDDLNNILWGRGSLDAKGIVAAMSIAVLEQKNRQSREDLALLFTVGEEESSDGAKCAAKKLAGRAHYIVVGEPTELKAASAQKGSLVFDLHAVGVEAHSALPHLGSSAIHKLVKVANRLINRVWPKDPILGDTLINIGMMSGGQMRNMLAKEASMKCSMRIVSPSLDIEARISENLSDDVSMTVLSACDPFDYVVPSGFDVFIAGFGSDAPYLLEVAKPLLLGPGSLGLAHKENEHIKLSELHDGLAAYHQIANQLRESLAEE
jgi:acetylornithine deacetylase